MPMNSNSPLGPPLSMLQDGLKLSFRERLLWLHDMLDFADRFGGATSGRKLDRDGNIVQAVRSSRLSALKSPVVSSSVVL